MYFILFYECRLLYFPRADAACADPHAFYGSIIRYNFYLLQVGQPAPLRYIVRMTDTITHYRTLAAYFTSLCHAEPLLILIIIHISKF